MKPLSFIIITYNRPGDTLELLMNIRQLQGAAELLQEVVVVNNASTADYTAVQQYVTASNFQFVYIDAPENLGVTRGRNFALQFSKADTIIFLDDDAVLHNGDALLNVVEAFEAPGFNNRPIAIVSFKVLYYDNLQMQQNALPHKRFEQYKNKSQFFTYYFAGGAHAIKRSALQAVGNLPDEFFYGMEEYDLSYRLIDSGYCIKYDSSIVMLHKESPLGRKTKAEKQRMMWVNKCKVAYRYLPQRYYWSTAVMWSLEYLKKTNFDVVGFFRGWMMVLKLPTTEVRRPVQASTLNYLKAVEARLWY